MNSPRTAEQHKALVAEARQLWLRAFLTTGRIHVPAADDDPWRLPTLTALIDACARDHDTRIDWTEHPSGWRGECTPAVAS